MHIKCIFHFASMGMQTLRIRGATKYEGHWYITIDRGGGGTKARLEQDCMKWGRELKFRLWKEFKYLGNCIILFAVNTTFVQCSYLLKICIDPSILLSTRDMMATKAPRNERSVGRILEEREFNAVWQILL